MQTSKVATTRVFDTRITREPKGLFSNDEILEKENVKGEFPPPEVMRICRRALIQLLILTRRRGGFTLEWQLHTKKRSTSARSSALGAIPATKVSGETFLSLHKACTVRILKNIPTRKNYWVMLVQVSHQPSPYCCKPILDGRKRKR